jgi:hypothetical protein
MRNPVLQRPPEEFPADQARSTLTGRRQGLRKLSPDLISKARDETATQVTRIGLTFLGTAAFCLLSLLSPDSALLGVAGMGALQRRAPSQTLLCEDFRSDATSPCGPNARLSYHHCGLKILATEPFAASPAAWRARQLGFLRETQDPRGGRQLQVQLAAMDREADGARDVLQEALGEGPRRALCACCR